MIKALIKDKRNAEIREVSMIISISDSPEFKVRPVDKTVGVGRSVSLQCVVEGNPAPTIYWRKRSQHANAEKVS